MARLRCIPVASDVSDGPTTGSGSAPPAEDQWSLDDDQSAEGNIIRVDVTSLPSAEAGYQIDYFEAEIEEQGTSLRIEHLLYGPAVGKARRLFCTTPREPQQVRIRSVQRLKNQFAWKGSYNPQVGDAVSQPGTGATATVAGVMGNYVVLDNMSGSFEQDEVTIIAGNSGKQNCPLHVTHIEAQRVYLRSEWSAPKTLSPTAGTPAVEIKVAKTTCLQGESLLLEAVTQGFQCKRPLHDLHYRFHVDKPGEQGSYDALPSSFGSEFGSDQNNRAEGFSSVWAFAPQTTGTVTVHCTVRDRSGNVVTGSIDLIVEAPVDAFADADIYAASSAGRTVPGAPGAKIYPDLTTLVSNLPSSGEGLILLDTTDTHDDGLYTQFRLFGLCPDRLVVMPYNNVGVGFAAGERTTCRNAFAPGSAVSIIHGIDMIGPYDPTNPFSITSVPQEAWNSEIVGQSSVDGCRMIGWGKGIVPPRPGSDFACSNVEITDYFDYAIHGGDLGRQAIAGCFLYHNPQSWRRGGKQSQGADNTTDGFHVDHTNYRGSRPDGSRGFSKCVFFSCCGWGGTSYSQPAARFFGSADTGYPNVFHSTECIYEAATTLAVGTSASGGNENSSSPQDMVFDKIVVLPAMQPGSSVSISVGGVTFRNTRVAVSDKAARGSLGSGIREHFSVNGASAATVPPQFDCDAQPVRIESVTVGDLRVDSGQARKEMTVLEIGQSYPLTDVVMSNELAYAPNFSASGPEVSTDLEPLNTTPRWTPMYAGEYHWEDGVPLESQTADTSWATPNTVTASFEPGPGSSAYQTATGVIPYDDIRSRVRPNDGTASRGAYDPGGTKL